MDNKKTGPMLTCLDICPINKSFSGGDGNPVRTSTLFPLAFRPKVRSFIQRFSGHKYWTTTSIINEYYDAV